MKPNLMLSHIKVHAGIIALFQSIACYGSSINKRTFMESYNVTIILATSTNAVQDIFGHFSSAAFERPLATPIGKRPKYRLQRGHRRL